MQKVPWFISLRYQGLLAILIIAVTMAGLLVVAHPNATAVSSQQKANAERWLDHLQQNLINERLQTAQQLLRNNQENKQGDFVFLHWFPENSQRHNLPNDYPLDNVIVAELLRRPLTADAPITQIECLDQCWLVQAFSWPRDGQAGRTIAISPLSQLLIRLQQEAGIRGLFLGSIPPHLANGEQWQNEPLDEHWSLLSSTQESLPPTMARRLMAAPPTPGLTLGEWSQQLVSELPDSQVWLSHLANSPKGGPQYLLLIAQTTHDATTETASFAWFGRLTAVILLLGLLGLWSYWQFKRLRQVNALLPQILQPQQESVPAKLAPRCRDELSVLTDGVTVLNQQLTDHKKLLEQQAIQLQQHSLYDPLTGLPNRDCFMFEVGRNLAALQRYPDKQALLLLEINGFRQLSHSVGHQEGERLLQKVAQELRLSVREADLLCHLSDDLFALLVTTLQEVEQIHLIVNKLQSRLESSLLLANRNFSLRFSAGIVLIDSSDTPATELLRQAEMALNEVKQQSTNSYQIYTPRLHEKSVRNHFIEERFALALRNGELYLQYQPIKECRQQRITGLEALSRWQLPLEGNISPLEFIPILENSRLVLQFGRWVIEQALHQLHQLDVAGMTGLQMAINLTGQQLLDPELHSTLERLTLTYHIIPSRISLELNEQALRFDYQRAQKAMETLHRAGYRLTLDDFGTGYSALTYLSRLPFDNIKLDRSFTLRMLDSDIDKQLVGSIIQMAHSLGKRIIGEGVDNSLQSLLLQELGCDLMQGCLLASPIGECNLISQLAPLYQAPSLNSAL